MRLLFIGFVWLRLAVCVVAADASAVRVAVIGDAENQNLSALVAAELTHRGAVAVVEREDLAKIGDESKLRAMAAGQPLELGKLLRADGLVFFGKGAVRLTGVDLGYALFDARIAPGADLAAQARGVAQRVESYAAKLRLTPERVVPISVLNLRCEVGGARAAALERDLTLLLESRLAAVPEYVVLERRHAGALGFERSLEPEARPLLQGSYLLDGTLAPPPADRGELTARLRLVSPHADPQTVEVRGDAHDLPGFAEKLAAAIRQATGHVSDPGVWQPEKEAREYLLEALWAWQHRVRDAAWEAADSAALLGERSADLAALRINLLLDRAEDGVFHPADSRPTGHPVGSRPLDDRTDDLLQALVETARYADGGLEKKIALSDPRQNLDVRAWEMKKAGILLGTELIARLDEARAPRADDVRRALRPFTGYDPLAGKSGTHSPAASWLQPSVYTDRWALTLEEARAWLRLSCSVPGGYVEPRLITGQGKDFCPRFLKTTEAQAAAFQEFVAGLRDDPATRLAARVIDTGSADPAAADAACRAYVDALWPSREALSANQPHRREWTDLGEIPEAVRRRQAGTMIPLLRYYLTHAESFEFGTFCIRPMWLPADWSAADAGAVWADYQECKRRMEEDRRKRGRNVSWLNDQQRKLEDPLLKKFPALAAVQPSGDHLAVTRYWHPWRTPGCPGGRFLLVDAEAEEDGLWLLGYFRGEEGLQARLYRVASTGFETEAVPLPAEHVNARRMEVTRDAVEVDYDAMGDVPSAEAHRASRFDRRTRTWTTSVVSPPDAEYRHAAGQNFVLLPDALGRVDPATGQTDLLISRRRKPPRNPLDGDSSSGIPRVFAGPGDRPCVVAEAGVFYVQAEPGDWSPVCDIGLWPSSATHGGQTVVTTWDGEAVLLDPARPEPEYLMAPDGGFYRGRSTDGQKTGTTKMPWRQSTVWDTPGKGTGGIEMNAERVAWQDERFFVLSQPPSQSQRYELLAYSKKGGRKPVRVPLEFRLDEAARGTLAPIYNGEPASDASVQSIEHPGYGYSALKPVAGRQGLWLYSGAGSVWFIAYADLDEYAKNHPANPDATLPASPSPSK